MASPGGPLLAKLTERLADREETVFHYVMHKVPRARPPTIARTPQTSSLGTLDALPTELLLQVIGHLDFQSLSRLASTCLSAKSAVEHLAPYAELMRHAPRALTALALTRILSHHPAALLHQALRSSKCSACADFGGHLFLPTCERVCYECLDRDEAFRVDDADFARQRLSLSEGQIARLPILHSTPESYEPRRPWATGREYRLVSARQLQRLVEEVHGPVEEGGLFGARPEGPGAARMHLVERRYGGRVAFRFPSVRDGAAEWGVACRGCQVGFHKHGASLRGEEGVWRVPEECRRPKRGAQWVKTRLRPWAEHVEHVREHVRGYHAVGPLVQRWVDEEEYKR